MLVVISFRPHHSNSHSQHAELVHGAARILHRLNYKICVAAPIAENFSPQDPRVLHLPHRSDPTTLHRLRCEARAHIFSHGEIDEAMHLVCSLRQYGINPVDYPLVFLGYHSFEQERLADFLSMPDASNVHCLEPCSALNELPGLLAKLIPKKVVLPDNRNPGTFSLTLQPVAL